MKSINPIYIVCLIIFAQLGSPAYAKKIYASHADVAEGESGGAFYSKESPLSVAKTSGKNQVYSICYESGFDSADQFSEGKKECTGKKPGEYSCTVITQAFCYSSVWE